MIEKRISIGNIDPIDFYGVNNSKFNLLKEYFPKLKITARGDEIIIQGEINDIEILNTKIIDIQSIKYFVVTTYMK